MKYKELFVNFNILDNAGNLLQWISMSYKQ